jgi:hypothetical protein
MARLGEVRIRLAVVYLLKEGVAGGGTPPENSAKARITILGNSTLIHDPCMNMSWKGI